MKYSHLLGMHLSEAEAVLKNDGKTHATRETRSNRISAGCSGDRIFREPEPRVVKIENREDGEISVVFCMIPGVSEG